MYDKELNDISMNAGEDKMKARHDMEEFLAGKGLDKVTRIEFILNFIVDETPQLKEPTLEHKLKQLNELHQANAVVDTKSARIASKFDPEGVDRAIKEQQDKLGQGEILLQLWLWVSNEKR